MKKLILFGTGSGAEQFISEFEIQFSYCLDNNSEKWDKHFSNLKIYSPEVLLNELKDDILVWVVSSYYDEISKQLGTLGLEEGNQYINGLNYLKYWEAVKSIREDLEEMTGAYIPFSKNDLLKKTDLSDILPPYERTLRVMCSLINVLADDFNHFQGSYEWNCMDKNGDPIPWYTHPAIEYLKQLDFSGKSIFEYGSGNSTLFWGARARTVTSVESSSSWFEKVIKNKLENTQIYLKESPEDYIDLINRFCDSFDVIVIDGEYRMQCAKQAVNKLNPGGLIILDNSDRHACGEITEMLRDSGLIQVDMSGFGPINSYTWSTTFFFHREFNMRPVADRQPEIPTGGLI